MEPCEESSSQHGWKIGNENDLGNIVEQVTQAAESAVQQTGFAYEQTTGLYYHYDSGYYYDPVINYFLIYLFS